jgi:hypothetical protein
MEKKYAFLGIAILVAKILSYAALVLGLAGALIILFGKTPATGKLASLGVLLMGGLYAFIFYMVSDLIRLWLDMDQKINRLETNLSSTKREIR